ncbi:hypothetical protein [Actinoplanes sp. NPDC051851]|uniref:hypothetical protein n=1 Tax=Actinoplanes sp. NPDC051851 TaxID=3154753 RepID=UPI00341F240D
MAAVTAPGSVRATAGRRRWLVGVVAGWVVVVAGTAVWSERNDPPTVAEQRTIAQAVPRLQAATGTVLAAAEEAGWVVRLGALSIADCRITPVRTGRLAKRDVVVYAPAEQAREALDAVAGGLPADYRAGVTALRGGTELGLYADAGEFIRITSEVAATDQVLTITVDTGCRPADDTVDRGDPGAGDAPEALSATLTALGAPADAAVTTEAVGCPGGGTAATFEASGGAGGGAPRGMPDGTTLVWSGADGWAYAKGRESVVITDQGDRLRVSVTTVCRA